MREVHIVVVCLMLAGCGGDETSNNTAPDAGGVPDMGMSDGGSTDLGGSSEDTGDGDETEDAGTARDVDGAGDASGDAGVDDPDLADVEPDYMARLHYTNQRVFREDKFFARGGTAVVELIAPQELPADERPEFFNADGERCTFESGTEWPTVPPGGDTWPAGPFLDGGDVTLTVDGAPGPVVFGYLDTYYIRDAPGPVMIDNITHNSFFPPEYVPHGSGATLATAGGPSVGPFSVDGLTIAADYTVSAPDLETGEDVIDTGAELEFTWSPPSPGDTMAVIVKDSFGFVKCRFEDDGSATVPADAMMQLIGGEFVRITIQTWREHAEDRVVMTEDGDVVDVEFLSRHTQIGRFGSM